MSTRIVPVLAVALLGLAVAPWIIGSCAARPLVPEVYAAERSSYETRVAESQQATRSAERQQPGSVNVVVLGVADESVADESVADESVADESVIEAPVQPMLENGPATLTPQPTPAKVAVDNEVSVTVRVIGTVTVTAPYTATARVVVEPEDLVTLTPVTNTGSLSTPAAASTGTTLPAVQPAAGMTAVDDVITERMLAEQLLRDAAKSGFRLSNLSVHLTAGGITASGNVEVLPKLRQAAQVIASFAVENESLVIKVTSIRLNNQDVTTLYKGLVTSSVNSSLYKLLPQRFVKSFELDDGQVTVHSETKVP